MNNFLLTIIEVSICLSMFQEGSKPSPRLKASPIHENTPRFFFDPVGYKEVYAFRSATSQHGNKQNPVSSEEFRHPDIQECPVMQRIIQYIFWIKVPNLIRYLAINSNSIPFGVLTYPSYEMPFS